MTRRHVLLPALTLSLATLAVWQATGGDYYTKFEVIETVEAPTDANDPLAAAGFYDGGSSSQTRVKNEFHLGLLPTPSRLLDKHWLAVAPLLLTIWTVFSVAWWKRRRRARP